MQVSEAYNAALSRTMHAHATRKIFSGRGCLKHRDRILELALLVGAQSALDYGCGKGAQYADQIMPGKTLEQLLGFEVAKYDPAVKEYRRLPAGQFDLVWCVDVLEMIPEQDMGWILEEIVAKARRALFLTVATYPAKKRFADGSNTHVTVQTAEWWAAQFQAVADAHPGVIVTWQIA